MTATIFRRAASTVTQGAPDAALFVNAAAQGGPPSYLRHFTGLEASPAACARNQALNGTSAGIIGTPVVQAAGYITLPPGAAINTGVPFAPAMSWFGVSRCVGWTGAAGGYGALMGNQETGGAFNVNINLLNDLHSYRSNGTSGPFEDLACPVAGAPGSPVSWFLWGLRFNAIGSGGVWQVDDFTAGTTKAGNSGFGVPASLDGSAIYIGTEPQQTVGNLTAVDWKAAKIFSYLVAPGSADEAATLAQLRAWALTDLGVTI